MKRNKNILIWGGGLRSQNIVNKIKNTKYFISNKLNIKYIFDNSLTTLKFKTNIIFSNKLSELKKIIKDSSFFIVAIGSEHGKARYLISKELIKNNLKPLNNISNHALIDSTVIFGEGFQAEDGSIVNCNAKIGDFCIVNTNATIDHHTEIGHGCHVMPGATILGNIKIGNFVTIGANATILPHLNIGDGSFIGAGSVVTKNIKKNEIVKGNPAKKIRSTSHKIDLSPFKK
jgi:acetyltransferase EpsM